MQKCLIDGGEVVTLRVRGVDCQIHYTPWCDEPFYWNDDESYPACWIRSQKIIIVGGREYRQSERMFTEGDIFVGPYTVFGLHHCRYEDGPEDVQFLTDGGWEYADFKPSEMDVFIVEQILDAEEGRCPSNGFETDSDIWLDALQAFKAIGSGDCQAVAPPEKE